MKYQVTGARNSHEIVAIMRNKDANVRNEVANVRKMQLWEIVTNAMNKVKQCEK